MRKLLMAGAALATLGVGTPALAQVYDEGVGVRAGPFEFGVGPRYDRGWRYHEGYRARAECRVVRERVVTPSGRVIYRSTRTCD